MYKWQVFLGGIASATFVLAGTAAPALAQTVASSPLTTALPGLNSATSQAPARSPASSLASAPNRTPLSNATVPSLSSNEPRSGSTAAQNTLNGVTGTLPVSSLTGGLPNLGNVTGALSGVTGPQH